MIVFVTGATGLIGSNVCEQLIQRGDEVRALARPGSEVGPLREMGVTIVDNPTTDPYTVTKRAAYLETMRRAREGIVDACVVIPGGTFGPAPTPNRALEAPSFNLRLLLGLQKKMTQAVSFPIPWVLAS